MIRLGDIATACSGNVGNHSSVAVVAFTAIGFEFLSEELTPERLHHHLEGLGAEQIRRYELPNVAALNFVLYQSPDTDASRSLRIDSQGRLLGPFLLELELPAPDNLDDMLPDAPPNTK